MGFRVNPDRWLPMRQYVRVLWHFATTHVEDSPYNSNMGRPGGREQTQYQRRMGKIKTLDGPIHTLWVWKGRIQYNWFTIGYRCWRKGHNFDSQFITFAPGYDFVGDGAGRIKRVSNGKTVKHTISACTHCGKYRGHGRETV